MIPSCSIFWMNYSLIVLIVTKIRVTSDIFQAIEPPMLPPILLPPSVGMRISSRVLILRSISILFVSLLYDKLKGLLMLSQYSMIFSLALEKLSATKYNG